MEFFDLLWYFLPQITIRVPKYGPQWQILKYNVFLCLILEHIYYRGTQSQIRRRNDYLKKF